MNKLSAEKQEHIYQIMLLEYANHGFEKTSTNVIIKKSGISKGTLFNLYGNKYDQYTHLIDRTLEFFMTQMAKEITSVVPPTDFLDFLLFKSQMKFRISNKYKNEFKLMMNAYMDTHEDIKLFMAKKASLFAKESVTKNSALLKAETLKEPGMKDQIAGIINYTITGITDDYLAKCQDITNPEILEDMTQELESYVKVMRSSFFISN